ncbi:UDP-N-acetylmuramoyl-L-alanine--D-glutamate ligase [Deltaproteobacteria bacterium Smac51]|nr:UDP-N-acetylmuramoyl-L-alanine--D-glutamate ligase [Deltaproteobacteria bacterium Smac51]
MAIGTGLACGPRASHEIIGSMGKFIPVSSFEGGSKVAVRKFGKCAVVGAGISGQWVAELLLEYGAEVTFIDQKNEIQLAEAMDRFKGMPVKWVIGKDVEKGFTGQELIVVSPGVPWTFPGLKKAMKKTPVTGEMELSASLVNVPVIAISGSNGKTTTTGLVGYICRMNRVPVFVGGNIGEPLSRFILSGQKEKAVIVEASSYQLETVKKFRASAAALLNISPDHLDRYIDMAEYFKAKTNILINQTPEDLVVINEDDVLLAHKNTVARRFGFSRRHAPHFGAWVNDGRIIVNIDGREAASRAWDDFKLEGVHNQENVMAAVGLAMSLGIAPQAALDAATTFTPQRHRLELVGEFDEVKYYDDSKGTNVGAVAMALESFNRPVVLIAGGQGKGQDFRLLYKTVREKVRQVILIGEDRDKMESALAGAAPVSLADDMAEAVRQARAAAPRGSVVLLSPACASFDMFRDYKHRGDSFAQEVKRQNR